ncbi:MAG: lactate utilization protein [Christensenellaceae bacterium]|jgi:hypothetical protein|nr:lactate utilization protein [Christensenellaceae bacterium]
MFCENYDAFVHTLTQHGYTVHTAASAEAAKALALSLIGAGSVGCGGSMTVKDIGLYDALGAQGNTMYNHSTVPPQERSGVFLQAARADWYLCSTNALTLDGKLINIDGVGNRVGGMFSGPKKVLLIIGKNKLADTYDAGMERVKRVACVKNTRRLNKKTPCAATGACADCSSPDRICNVTSIIEYKPGWVQELHLILVDAELGY